jgi:hypothetical protein
MELHLKTGAPSQAALIELGQYAPHQWLARPYMQAVPRVEKGCGVRKFAGPLNILRQFMGGAPPRC